MDPVMISLAPTGLVPLHDQTPHVLLTAEEVAASCAHCCATGASMLQPGTLAPGP